MTQKQKTKGYWRISYVRETDTFDIFEIDMKQYKTKKEALNAAKKIDECINVYGVSIFFKETDPNFYLM